MADDSINAPIITRPPHFPTMHTRETCENLVAFGLRDREICVILKCTLEDLRLHYAQEMEIGLTRVNARVQAALLHRALYGDDVQAMKLWLINKAGWKAGDKLAAPGSVLDAPTGDGEQLTVVERKTVIERMLRVATEARIERASVIDGEVIKKPNGNGANGAKHR